MTYCCGILVRGGLVMIATAHGEGPGQMTLVGFVLTLSAAFMWAVSNLVARLASRVAPPGKTPRKKETGAALAETQAWEAAGLHCSANERRADEASRDVEAWLKCKYMREHLGEEFSGKVSAATSFGLFVTLDSLYVEGLVHITELGGEYYRFDEARQELRGERTGIRYALGTPVRVQVSRVDDGTASRSRTDPISTHKSSAHGRQLLRFHAPARQT